MGCADRLMAKIEIPYVQRFKDRHGKLRHYFRKPGCRTMALPGVAGSQEFMEAYQAAERASRPIGAEAVAAGTISAVIVAYYQSDDYLALQPQTRRTYRLILDRFRTQYGQGPAAKFEPEHMRRILDKMSDRPGAAKTLLKRVRGACRSGMKRGLLKRDPTLGVTVANRRSDGYRAWTDADIETFKERWPSGSRERLALYLLLYTGQRRSDVVTMGRQHVRDGVLAVVQRKTGAKLAIPLHPALKAEIAMWPAEHLTFMTTAYGKPFSAVGFSNWFVESARAAGLPPHSSPHGLRKAAARWLAEAGCSTLEIASITGHASLKEIERYTKSAAQHRLAASAMKTLVSAGMR